MKEWNIIHDERSEEWISHSFIHKWELTDLNDGFGNNGHY